MNTQENISRLLLTKRLQSRPDCEQNSLHGLYDLIKYANLNRNTIMAEIGSFSGSSSELFANHVGELFCIDGWKAYQEIDQPELDEAEKMFDTMMFRYGNIYKLKSDSVSAAKGFKDGQFDFIYIDASHAYEDVKRDILAWKPKVKNGGFIAGHDWIFNSVASAVKETLGNPQATFKDSSWIVSV